MSRVLKFRIWDKANKEYMILGATGLDARNGDVIDYYNEAYRLGGPEEYDVEQYTGLKDKNGKEIYEGDIVKYLSYRKEYIGKVVFDFVDDSEGYYVEKHYGWGIRRDGYNLSLGDYADDNMKCKFVEVISNIHENKELWGESI